ALDQRAELVENLAHRHDPWRGPQRCVGARAIPQGGRRVTRVKTPGEERKSSKLERPAGQVTSPAKQPVLAAGRQERRTNGRVAVE
ncbi:MAG: hypothetical protein K1000chlam4_00223, partial [Chlamydiae bacterium]|nr:hypothetical protein [Chlamydiota bacterium]